jgi:toxin ParE1/3/4
MVIIWSDAATQDLNDIWGYIARDNPDAATATVRGLRDTIQTRLVDQPEIGRPGRVSGTRELVVEHTPYVLPYRVIGQQLEIIRVYHASRRWPERFD